MYGKLKVLLGCSLVAVAPAALAQYTIDLTGVGNGTVADGVYVSPYQGTITGNGMSYSGYIICDDFYTDFISEFHMVGLNDKRRRAGWHREISVDSIV